MQGKEIRGKGWGEERKVLLQSTVAKRLLRIVMIILNFR
jgi:hypothetical protein